MKKKHRSFIRCELKLETVVEDKVVIDAYKTNCTVKTVKSSKDAFWSSRDREQRSGNLSNGQNKRETD